MNRLGYKSRRELQGVHIDMVIVVTTAIIILPAGFDSTVFDGLRTRPEQKDNMVSGVSWTMDSNHLPQADGWAHAVDLVPIVDGRVSWDDPDDPIRQKRIDEAFEENNIAMVTAAALHRIEIEWGFAMWGKDKPHWQLAEAFYRA